PSAWTVLELIRGLGPERVYQSAGRHARPLAPPASVLWFTGDKGPASGSEFRRWIEEGGGGKLQAGSVAAVFAERYAQLRRDVEHAQAHGQLQLLRGRVERIAMEDAGGFVIHRAGQATGHSVSAVILATGYQPDFFRLLDPTAEGEAPWPPGRARPVLARI